MSEKIALFLVSTIATSIIGYFAAKHFAQRFYDEGERNGYCIGFQKGYIAGCEAKNNDSKDQI